MWIRTVLDKKKRDATSRFKEKGLKSKMDGVMCSKRLYLNRRLSLRILAREVGTNRTYIWQELHYHRTSFRDYVNSYRLRYFIERAYLDEYRHMHVDDIATECGYMNTCALNRQIRQIFGITLKEYMRRVSEGM